MAMSIEDVKKAEKLIEDRGRIAEVGGLASGG
jgi:hypothetical protein